MYQVGDKVTIRTNLIEGGEYNGFLFIPPMKKYAGKITRITNVRRIPEGYAYRLKIDEESWTWTEPMLRSCYTNFVDFKEMFL